MLDQTKNILIGIFVLTALSIIIYIILFLHPSMGDEGQTIRVRFANVDKVNVGTRVLFAGHPVGEVVELVEVENARLESEIHNGEIYIFELTLKIDTGIDVYTSDDVSPKTAGLLGEKSVAITPLPPPPGQPLVKVTDQILFATNPPTVEDSIKVFNSVAVKAESALVRLNEQLGTIQKEKLWENLGESARNLSEITTAFNKADDISKMVINFRDFSGHLAEVSTNVRSGQGALGKLLVKDDFYLHLTSVMSKAETLMDDINHYGLLFQNDKNWQRARARRVNLLAQLSNPQEFQNYFDDEVDQISTSLARLSMVLKDTSQCNYLPVICSPQFIRVFADLLRRVESLQTDLKIFDQQVVDTQENCACPPLEVLCPNTQTCQLDK